MRSSDWSSDVCSSDLVFERFGELGDLALVNLGNAGMDIGNAHRRLGEPRGDLGFLAFEFSHTRFHGRLIKPIFDRGHDACNGLVDLRQRMGVGVRSEEHTSELQSLMRISYAVFCLKKKKKNYK